MTDTVPSVSASVHGPTPEPSDNMAVSEPTIIVRAGAAVPIEPTGSRVIRRGRASSLTMPIDLLALLAPVVWVPHHWEMIFFIGVLTVVLIYAAGLYRSRLTLSLLDEAPGLLSRLLIATALAETALVVGTRDIEWRPLIIGVCWSGVLLLLGRYLAYQVIRHVRRTGLVGQRTIIIGSGPIARELTTTLRTYPSHGLRPIGFVGAPAQNPTPDMTRLGDLSDLRALVDTHRVSVVLVADGAPTEQALVGFFRQPLRSNVTVLVVPRLQEVFSVSDHDDHIGAVNVSRVRPPTLTGPARAVKRSFDVLVSGLGLLLLAPLLAAVAVAVRLESGPGFLFRQTRLGQDGKPFELLKFRSMRPASENESATQWNIADDARVGRVGKLLRRSSVDELPQLWNILRGDMTLVGPRPERPHFVELFSGTYVDYGLRHRVPVGLTGLAQVSGLRGDTAIGDRARFDNFYIDHWSLWLDVKVLMRTVREVLGGGGR